MNTSKNCAETNAAIGGTDIPVCAFPIMSTDRNVCATRARYLQKSSLIRGGAAGFASPPEVNWLRCRARADRSGMNDDEISESVEGVALAKRESSDFRTGARVGHREQRSPECLSPGRVGCEKSAQYPGPGSTGHGRAAGAQRPGRVAGSACVRRESIASPSQQGSKSRQTSSGAAGRAADPRR
jgi:hypothetical protein